VRSLRSENLMAVMLSACIVGLAICPLPYVAIGALSAFQPIFSLLLLPPFLIGCGFLAWRFLARLSATASGTFLIIGEILSWAAVAVFLFFVSAFNLQTPVERVGLSSVFFLLTSAACVPLVLLRETALEARLKRLPKSALAGLLFLLLAAAGFAAARYVLAPAEFI
jgi:hypothetical protein